MLKDPLFPYKVTEVNSFNDQVSQIFLKPLTTAFCYYEAGQYVNVLHSDQIVSSLSVACAPRENKMLEFHLFHPLQNKLAQELLHLALHEQRWQIKGPYGNCTVGKLHQTRPILFIARGTGFSPIKAVIEALTSRQTFPSMHLYWSMPKREHFYLLDLLNAWAKTVSQFTFTLQFFDQKKELNFLVKEIVDDFPSLTEHQVYVSGSQPFVSTLFSALLPLGLKRDFYYSDMKF
jgi:CDP-4-dehydro-6-deoxyglucose reductase